MNHTQHIKREEAEEIYPKGPWINLKEEIPRKHEQVLFWDGYYIYLSDEFFFVSEGQYICPNGACITHWMRIPDPPNIDKN